MNNAILQVDQPIFFPAALPVFRNDEAASKTFVVTLCRAELPLNLYHKPHQIAKLKCFSHVLQLSLPSKLEPGVKSRMKI